MVAAMKRREFITLLAGWRGRSTPNVPVYQNTFFPPNQSTAKRSYRFGQVIKEAIELWPSEKASGCIRVRRHEPFCDR